MTVCQFLVAPAIFIVTECHYKSIENTENEKTIDFSKKSSFIDVSENISLRIKPPSGAQCKGNI